MDWYISRQGELAHTNPTIIDAIRMDPVVLAVSRCALGIAFRPTTYVSGLAAPPSRE